LGKNLLFGQKVSALGDFFQGKNWAIFSQKHLVTLTFNKIRPWLKEF
jgi:hypothetical protein